MSLYFVGWGKNFLGWGTAAPAPAVSTITSAGGGMGPLLPPRGIYQIPIPRPQLPTRKPRDDDEDAVLIHLLQ